MAAAKSGNKSFLCIPVSLQILAPSIAPHKHYTDLTRISQLEAAALHMMGRRTLKNAECSSSVGAWPGLLGRLAGPEYTARNARDWLDRAGERRREPLRRCDCARSE